MRISDWSSDVCSSDRPSQQRSSKKPQAHRSPATKSHRPTTRLPLSAEPGRSGDASAGPQRLWTEPPACVFIEFASVITDVNYIGVASGHGPSARDALGPSHGAEQIGRASCRERVCQYV